MTRTSRSAGFCRVFGWRVLLGLWLPWLLLLAGLAGAKEPVLEGRPLSSLSIEELADVEVTTASRRPESQLEAAAAVYVITQEDIRRSGVTTLVEALRLAPGVEVARLSGDRWAVGIRGFASRLSRSVLVLIDGRSVYTTLFAGTYWEVQDTLLEDVERIEVVRGPGGALWGANAVNGVINIITKSAEETPGTLLSVGAGSEERFFAKVRYGGAFGQRGRYRVYGKYVDRDSQKPGSGEPFDDWRRAQLGFRADTTTAGGSQITFQGDAYSARDGERTLLNSFTPPYRFTVDDDTELAGGNLRASWSRQRDDGEVLTFQGYYDRTERRQPDFREDRDVVDLDLQRRRRFGERQELTWGVGFRSTWSDTLTPLATVKILPPSRTEQLYSAYAQDEFHLGSRWRLTLGTKIEHNDYSGFEFQPTLRLAFLASEKQTFWTAVSKAVRTPSRVENDVVKSNGLVPGQPIFLRLIGDGEFRTERIIAYEAGYRRQLGSQIQLDLAVFYNDLDYLTTGERVGPNFSESDAAGARLVLPFGFRNGLFGHARGAELAADATLASWLKMRTTYSYLELDLASTGGDQVSGPRIMGSSPRHRAALALYADLPRHFGVDLTLRAVDRLPALSIPGYTNLDLRFSYQPTPQIEISLVGQGLLEADHLEFDDGEQGMTRIQRGFYGKLAWRF